LSNLRISNFWRLNGAIQSAWAARARFVSGFRKFRTVKSIKEISIEQLIAEGPHFHAWPDGTPANWAVAPDVLRFLARQLKPGMHTLETGAGQTTVAFALAGARHTCITPDIDQADRVQSYLRALKIDNTVQFIHKSSDVALPAGNRIPNRLDFVLIDGAHRFPFPILDWHYTHDRVRVGGIVAVDDYVMPSVRMLHEFLCGEKEWELIKAFEVTSFFRKVSETVSKWDWADQTLNKPHLERIKRKSQLKCPSGADEEMVRS
jgi:predicted O-methyltransferase YrrM